MFLLLHASPPKLPLVAVEPQQGHIPLLCTIAFESWRWPGRPSSASGCRRLWRTSSPLTSLDQTRVGILKPRPQCSVFCTLFNLSISEAF